jgi:hypothetical protein
MRSPDRSSPRRLTVVDGNWLPPARGVVTLTSKATAGDGAMKRVWRWRGGASCRGPPGGRRSGAGGFAASCHIGLECIWWMYSRPQSVRRGRARPDRKREVSARRHVWCRATLRGVSPAPGAKCGASRPRVTLKPAVRAPLRGVAGPGRQVWRARSAGRCCRAGCAGRRRPFQPLHRTGGFAGGSPPFQPILVSNTSRGCLRDQNRLCALS